MLEVDDEELLGEAVPALGQSVIVVSIGAAVQGCPAAKAVGHRHRIVARPQVEKELIRLRFLDGYGVDIRTSVNRCNAVEADFVDRHKVAARAGADLRVAANAREQEIDTVGKAVGARADVYIAADREVVERDVVVAVSCVDRQIVPAAIDVAVEADQTSEEDAVSTAATE